MRMFCFVNVISAIKGIKEMSEDQERSQLIDQVKTAQIECEQTEKSESRKNLIRIAVLAMAIVALFMALH